MGEVRKVFALLEFNDYTILALSTCLTVVARSRSRSKSTK